MDYTAWCWNRAKRGYMNVLYCIIFPLRVNIRLAYFTVFHRFTVSVGVCHLQTLCHAPAGVLGQHSFHLVTLITAREDTKEGNAMVVWLANPTLLE